jgi:acyl-CoA-binding protein
MTKKQAKELIESKENLEDKFNASVEVLKHSPEIAYDKMLSLYAYYKQARNGDIIDQYFSKNTVVTNYIETFKRNAWLQVRGLSSEEALLNYIQLTLEIIESEYKD